jgi:hypothetical protein
MLAARLLDGLQVRVEVLLLQQRHAVRRLALELFLIQLRLLRVPGGNGREQVDTGASGWPCGGTNLHGCYRWPCCTLSVCYGAASDIVQGADLDIFAVQTAPEQPTCCRAQSTSLLVTSACSRMSGRQRCSVSA